MGGSIKTQSRLRALLMRGLRIGGAVYLLACVGCATLQRRMIYFPPVFAKEVADQTGKTAGLERWNAPDGKPIGWKRMSPTQPAQGRILITHGNGGAACQLGHYADVIQQVSPMDVFIVEYPGYGDRPGKPTERTLDEASEEAFQLLATNGPVHLVGESLGTGVATYLAGKHPEKTAGVVLLAPYNSLVDVAQAHMPILPVGLMLIDRFPSEKYLRTYRGPVAIVVADDDQVVPPRFGRRLYESYPGPKRLWEVPQGGHEGVMDQPAETWRQMIGFLQAGHALPG